ncbi:MAG: hypothetical protein JJT94_13455 [Bernardetiaceae bacterium]|nr:hypothetical protein [Bernardetiaceae bacterium]
MQKFITQFLIFTVLVLTFSACGNKDDDGAPADIDDSMRDALVGAYTLRVASGDLVANGPMTISKDADNADRIIMRFEATGATLHGSGIMSVANGYVFNIVRGDFQLTDGQSVTVVGSGVVDVGDNSYDALFATGDNSLTMGFMVEGQPETETNVVGIR